MLAGGIVGTGIIKLWGQVRGMKAVGRGHYGLKKGELVGEE